MELGTVGVDVPVFARVFIHVLMYLCLRAYFLHAHNVLEEEPLSTLNLKLTEKFRSAVCSVVEMWEIF